MPTPRDRHLEPLVRRAARQFPIITLTGPRQSGKTTLARTLFPDKPYLSLEDGDVRRRVEGNPREVLQAYADGAIFDEAQRAPELFSYLQTEVDRDPRRGRFVLTGSENLVLSQNVAQSLAGRTLLLKLLPFTEGELIGRPARAPGAWQETTEADRAPRSQGPAWTERAFRGYFPPCALEEADAVLWLGAYLETYVERDVRQILNVGDLDAFRRFMKLVAGRSGQVLNHSQLAVDAAISTTTARKWLSVLEATYVVRTLPPFHENFNKRVVKAPKLYLLDVGLMCRLLALRNPEDAATHPLRGAIFETMVVGELCKAFLNAGEEPPLSYWRDRSGHEVDVIVDLGVRRVPIEIKSSESVRDDDVAAVRRWMKLGAADRGAVIYAGDATWGGGDDGVVRRSWRDLT